jgi:hypothetical protein
MSCVRMTLDGVLNWRLDLLATYRSELQITITLSQISTLHKSLKQLVSEVGFGLSDPLRRINGLNTAEVIAPCKRKWNK